MYHPLSEKIVDILVDKTSTNDRHFFRCLVAFYFSTTASMMRTNIKTHDRGTIPVNTYALLLGVSGLGKNYSSNILEELIIDPFKDNYIPNIFYANARANIAKLAIEKQDQFQDDPTLADEEISAEFEMLGPPVFVFDSATSPAIKQLRRKLLMAGAGSLNLAIDEIGSNLTNNMEALTDYLSLYDKGYIKEKITKNTRENKRGIELYGTTPANLLMFGTPSKLFNGGKTEEEFFNLLETGYARRLIFAFSRYINKKKDLTPEEIYEAAISNSIQKDTLDVTAHFQSLADTAYFKQYLTLDKKTAIELIAYRLKCEDIADSFKEHEDVAKAEMSHRYYKAIKLAGAYAFVDKSHVITSEYLKQAIQLVEDSGEAFNGLMNRDRNYVKLAKYMAQQDVEVTQADLVEDLPFYNGSEVRKRELMNLAVAYGYKNNIVIKRNIENDIEFFSGESLEETNLDKITVSYSTDITTDFVADVVPWTNLHELTSLSGYHFTVHHFKNGYRSKDNLIKGFNLVALDVDEGTTLDTAKLLLKDYTYLIYTTKRHTINSPRFRILLPLTHTTKLDASEYTEFMKNVFEWLPFNVDTAASDCARKWETNPSEYFYNEGNLLDTTLFIPRTKKADEQANYITKNSNLTNLERWFVANTTKGNRNHTLVKYGFVLVDKGYSLDVIRSSIMEFNHKLSVPLPEEEILSTVMVTLTKKVTERG